MLLSPPRKKEKAYSASAKEAIPPRLRPERKAACPLKPPKKGRPLLRREGRSTVNSTGKKA